MGVFNGNGINRLDENHRKDVATRVVVHPLPGMSLAGEYYNGATGVQKLARERWGSEWAYIKAPYSLIGEYIWGHDDVICKRGWYALFAYRLRPQWEGLFRFDNYDPNLRTSKDQTNTYLVGLNYFVSEWVKFQANCGLASRGTEPRLAQVVLGQIQFSYQLSGKKGESFE